MKRFLILCMMLVACSSTQPLPAATPAKPVVQAPAAPKSDQDKVKEIAADIRLCGERAKMVEVVGMILAGSMVGNLKPEQYEPSLDRLCEDHGTDVVLCSIFFSAHSILNRGKEGKLSAQEVQGYLQRAGSYMRRKFNEAGVSPVRQAPKSTKPAPVREA